METEVSFHFFALLILFCFWLAWVKLFTGVILIISLLYLGVFGKQINILNVIGAITVCALNNFILSFMSCHIFMLVGFFLWFFLIVCGVLLKCIITSSALSWRRKSSVVFSDRLVLKDIGKLAFFSHSLPIRKSHSCLNVNVIFTSYAVPASPCSCRSMSKQLKLSPDLIW